MLEGGGAFNGAMLEAGLANEISQVIVPAVDGGTGITGLFEVPNSRNTSVAAKLRLIKTKIMPRGVIWLRYKVRAI